MDEDQKEKLETRQPEQTETVASVEQSENIAPSQQTETPPQQEMQPQSIPESSQTPPTEIPEVAQEITQPVQEVPQPIPPTTIPAPEIPATSEPQKPIEVVAPAPVSAAPLVFQKVLAKAKEIIQFRKRSKLEKIIKLAKNKVRIKNDDVEKLLHVSDTTAANYLTILVKEGKLKKEGKNSTSCYILLQ